MGPKAVQEELQHKYNIEIPYQTVFYGRQRQPTNYLESGMTPLTGCTDSRQRLSSDHLEVY